VVKLNDPSLADWYVYRHVRKDKNETFYIGIGCKPKFRRAYEKDKRNKHWENIVNITDYTVEILLTNLNKSSATLYEKKYIKIYGKSSDNTGTLCNKTDGGEGGSGKWSESKREKIQNYWKNITPEQRKKHLRGIMSEECLSKQKESIALYMADPEARRKKSESMKGRKHTEETKKKMSESKKGAWTEERLLKYRETMSKKPKIAKELSEETRQKMRDAKLGKKLSPETKEKMSKAQILRNIKNQKLN